MTKGHGHVSLPFLQSFASGFTSVLNRTCLITSQQTIISSLNIFHVTTDFRYVLQIFYNIDRILANRTKFQKS